MSTGKVVLGTIAGIAIGGILGLLYAPEKGLLTRKKIIDNGNDYVDNLKSKFSDIADSITEQLHHAKEFAQEITENSEAAMENLEDTDSKFKL